MLESGDAEAALKDVNRAICLNNQYAPAYSLRAKLRMQEIAEHDQADEEEEEKNEGKITTEGEKSGAKVEALQHAAEDALLGKGFSYLFFLPYCKCLFESSGTRLTKFVFFISLLETYFHLFQFFFVQPFCWTARAIWPSRRQRRRLRERRADSVQRTFSEIERPQLRTAGEP